LYGLRNRIIPEFGKENRVKRLRIWSAGLFFQQGTLFAGAMSIDNSDRSNFWGHYAVALQIVATICSGGDS